MAVPTQTGIAQLRGINGTTTPVTISALANLTFKPQKADLSHEMEVQWIKDNNSYDIGAASMNEYIEGSLEFEIIADTKAHAAASAVFLAPMSKVTLSNFDMTAVNGDWLYIGKETIALSAADVAKMKIPIRKYSDATQNAAMLVQPS